MRKSIILLIFLFGIVASAASATFVVDVKPVVDEILPGETAVFLLDVNNTGGYQEDIRLVFPDNPAWSIITTPIYHQTSFTIAPGESETTTIYIQPAENVDFGHKYTYSFLVQSNINKANKQVDLGLFLRSSHTPGYVPTVVIDVDLDSEIDPREGKDMKVILTNFNSLNITNLVLDISSIINPDINREMNLTLEGLEKKIVTIPISYDPLQTPSVDYITVKAHIPNQNVTIDPVSKKIEILEYSNVVKNAKPTYEFLKTSSEISFFNDGNVDKSVNYTIPTSIFKQIFTSEDPKGSVVTSSGMRSIVWSFTLAPQETETVKITVNYRPLFIIIILIIIAVVLYFVFRSAVTIRKQAVILSGDNDDSSSVKVLLHVKNRTGRVIENINVMDKVPAIAEINKEFPVGTMHPSKVIRHEKKGTIVKWDIPTLETYEERIITYNIKSKLKIIGGVRLPAAMIKYKNKIGRFTKVFSNKTSAN